MKDIRQATMALFKSLLRDTAGIVHTSSNKYKLQCRRKVLRRSVNARVCEDYGTIILSIRYRTERRGVDGALPRNKRHVCVVYNRCDGNQAEGREFVIHNKDKCIGTR